MMKILRSRKLALFMAVTLILFMGLSNALVTVFAEEHGIATLYVNYEDGTSTETEVRDHPSTALHFDVYKSPASIVTSATLVLSDGTEIEWGGQGHDEENNLDDTTQGGYWHWVYSPQSGILTISNSNYTELEEEPMGSITIQKVLQDGDDTIADSDVEFTVNVSNGDGFSEEVTFSVNNPVTLDELELGTYNIEEIDIPDGYELVSISPDEVTLSEENLSVTVTVTNMVEMEDPTGTLIIEKVLQDEGGTEIAEDDTEFTINVTGPEGYDEDHTFSVDEDAVITGLTLGTYELNEVSIPEDFEFVSISDETVELSVDTLSVTVTVTNEVTIDDDPEDPLGSITIEKILFDDDDEILDSDVDFTVNITGPEGYDEDHTFSVNEPVEVEDLELGTYSINEINVPEGYEFLSISSEEVTLTEGTLSVTVFVTNMVEPEDVEDPTGTLIINKVLLDTFGIPVEADGTEFSVNITGPEGYDAVHTFSVDESAVVSGLTLGVYEIEEISIPDEVEFVSITDESVELTEEELSISVTVTNEIVIDDEPEDPTGTISIEKVLLDGTDTVIEDSDQEFMVNISNGDDYNQIHTFSVNEPLEVDELELGTYTIEEINIPEGIELVSVSSEEVTLEEGNLSAVVFITNTFIIDDEPEDPTGTISIEKVLLDGDDEVEDSDVEFTVNVSNGDDYDEEHTFSVNQPLELEGLALGTYTIEEINIPEGYEFVTISSEEVTLEEGELEAFVFVTNMIDEEDIDDIDDEDEIDDIDDEDEVILDEEVPLGEGELPRTGQRHVAVFYVTGLLITGLGVTLKRFVF